MTKLNVPEEFEPYLVFEEILSYDPFNRAHYVYRFENGYGASVLQGYNRLRGGQLDDEWELATILFDTKDNDSYELIYGNPVCDEDIIAGLSNKDVTDALYSIKGFTKESLAEYSSYRFMEE